MWVAPEIPGAITTDGLQQVGAISPLPGFTYAATDTIGRTVIETSASFFAAT